MGLMIVQLYHAIPAVRLAIGSLANVLMRANFVGIIGIILELCSGIVLTAVHTARARLQARHWS